MDNSKESIVIGSNDIVTVTTMQHLTEVQWMKGMNHKAHIKKIDKDNYMVLETGEIKQCVHGETRKDNTSSLRKTFKKMRYLINNNFSGRSNELFVTLTYAENMTDPKRLYTDFKAFIKRFNRKYPDVDYICVVEPQERGAWHCHVLLKFNSVVAAFVPNPVMAEIWGHGFVTVRSVEGVDNIGAYLTAYLTDVELTDKNEQSAYGHEIAVKKVDGIEKKYIKGGRLHLYPSGMNLIRKSRGILYPERELMTYRKAKKKIKKIAGSAKPHYSKTYEIDGDGFKNTITFEQYNSKRV